MTRILLADDDQELCDMLMEYLATENIAVDAVHDGARALATALESHYDLMILDVMMPVMNGFDVLRELRSRSTLPVLMLTARGDDVDSIVGLELGADDYLAKPTNPRVLVARIRAILRRQASTSTNEEADNQPLTLGDLELRPGSREVLRNGQPIAMTGTEFSLLALLLDHAGAVIAKSAISEDVLGRKLGPWDRSVDVHISNLRKKLGPLPDGSERIKTVRGQGYLLARS